VSKRVVVGLSGGVDSSVAAYLLKKQGYEVIAVFMVNWHDRTGVLDADCPWDEDVIFAEMVARKIGIPFHVEDLSGPYKKRVIDYMFSEYEKGRTPNPDVLCNREIKFDEFIRATEKYAPDFVATGHYCKKEEIESNGRTIYRLMSGDDPGKEQSYFLCQLSQEQLAKTLFPIGHLHKSEVRKIAREQKLASAEKKDSQGICFVGKVHLPDFLQQKLEPKEGNIFEVPADSPLYNKNTINAGHTGSDKTEKESKSEGVQGYPELSELKRLSKPIRYKISDGTYVGKHRGAHFFTIGQRKGLQVGGKKEPLFVIATDVTKNRIFVGQGQSHPGLYRRGLHIRTDEIHWVRPDLTLKPDERCDYMVRIRYRQELEQARLFMAEEGMYIIFEKPQRGVAAGQFAAWYKKGELIGSGVIDQ
jgi:tRNA-uridine 2-sulfurtransferase